jgi:hypothetical protein
VKTTWYGDADLDGFVTLADYSQWAANFGQPGTWLTGDFDGDGSVTLADYSLWAGAFSFTNNGTTGFPGADGPAAASPGVVPEPGSLGLLAVGMLGLLGNRRKRSVVTNAPSNCEA